MEVSFLTVSSPSHLALLYGLATYLFRDNSVNTPLSRQRKTAVLQNLMLALFAKIEIVQLSASK